ncbi:unnamed protein product [Ceratitis capitata]|uniref:(Mediterranean fruit fly) hypothetical protein n=1 Tax=Ceratitis capitata TaxID=7213 RepID=A0A811V372_CERCA|nr:unnamed protein product [Ceratitis capitata]
MFGLNRTHLRKTSSIPSNLALLKRGRSHYSMVRRELKTNKTYGSIVYGMAWSESHHLDKSIRPYVEQEIPTKGVIMHQNDSQEFVIYRTPSHYGEVLEVSEA